MRTILILLVSACAAQAAEPWYHPESPWRQPIGSNPAVISSSAYYVGGNPANGMKAFSGYTLTSDTSQYTYPVHYVDNSMPQVTINFSGVLSEVRDDGLDLTGKNYDPTDDGDGDEDWTKRHGSGKGTYAIHIDPNARYEIPSGSDRQFIIINRDTGEEFGVWQATDNDGDGLWEPWNGDGVRNGYVYNTNWLAYPPVHATNNNFQFLSRGAGVPYGAGLIRREEIEAGRIDHVIAFAFPRNHDTDFIFPATRTDGANFSGDGPLGDTLAEGQLVQLDPSISETTMRSWGLNDAGVIVAKALQEYGMITIDNSGSFKLIAEYESTARWSELPSSLRIQRNTLSSIPVELFRPIQSPHGFNTLLDIHDYDVSDEPPPDDDPPPDDTPDDLTARVEALEALVAGMQETLARLQATTEEHATRLEALEITIRGQDARIAAIEATLDAVRQAFGINNTTASSTVGGDVAVPEPSGLAIVSVLLGLMWVVAWRG